MRAVSYFYKTIRVWRKMFEQLGYVNFCFQLCFLSLLSIGEGVSGANVGLTESHLGDIVHFSNVNQNQYETRKFWHISRKIVKILRNVEIFSVYNFLHAHNMGNYVVCWQTRNMYLRNDAVKTLEVELFFVEQKQLQVWIKTTKSIHSWVW